MATLESRIQPDSEAFSDNAAHMAGLVDLDAHDLTATFLAGTNGMEAERLVEKEGLTIGHWPQSIDVSTVGGWVATRASGQYSTGYGSIEDLVLDLEAVLPDGSVLRTRRTPRASAGPDLRQIFLGSEGILGVVTEVTFSLRPLPEASRDYRVPAAMVLPTDPQESVLCPEALRPVRQMVSVMPASQRTAA